MGGAVLSRERGWLDADPCGRSGPWCQAESRTCATQDPPTLQHATREPSRCLSAWPCRGRGNCENGGFTTSPESTVIRPTKSGTLLVCQWRIHPPKIAIGPSHRPPHFRPKTYSTQDSSAYTNHIETVVSGALAQGWQTSTSFVVSWNPAPEPARNTRLPASKQVPSQGLSTTTAPKGECQVFLIFGNAMASPAYISGCLTFFDDLGLNFRDRRLQLRSIFDPMFCR